MTTYVGLANYKNNLKQLGFDEAEFDNGGSDKLVNAIVARGDEQIQRGRIQAHWSSETNHVCIQTFKDEVVRGPDMALLELLAPHKSPR